MACDQLAPLCLIRLDVMYIPGSRAVVHSFIPQIFIAYPLCARHCSVYLGYISEQKGKNSFPCIVRGKTSRADSKQYTQ